MTTVFIISAPSGSGKSTLVGRLLQLDSRLRFSISFTTRPPRGTERQGEHYRFISRGEFIERLERDEFLEYAEVFGHYYGTSRAELAQAEREGKDLVLDIDVQGARQLRGKLHKAVSIFILAPSREILEQRLKSRSEDSEVVIQRRLREAAEEIENYADYDYILVNESVDESVDTLRSIIKAERVRRERMEEKVRPILASFEQKIF